MLAGPLRRGEGRGNRPWTWTAALWSSLSTRTALRPPFVFKTVADPFIGKLSYVKVVSGKISTDSQLVNMRTGNTERVGKTVMLVGKKQVDVKYIGAGDIGAIPKLTATNTGDTLCSPTRKVTLDGVEYPNPTLRMAIVPAKKGEEDKVAQGMMRLLRRGPHLAV